MSLHRVYSFTAALTIVTKFSGPHPVADAQLDTGLTSLTGGGSTSTCHKAYMLKDAAGAAIGSLVAVEHGCTTQPTGLEAGNEYWRWEPGHAWPHTFHAVPLEHQQKQQQQQKLQQQEPEGWNSEIFPLDHFDLTTTMDMPPATPQAGDRFYKVIESTKKKGAIRHRPPSLSHVAYMWLKNNGSSKKQEWMGLAGQLTNDLVGVDARGIRFVSVDAPENGFVGVHPLCDGLC